MDLRQGVDTSFSIKLSVLTHLWWHITDIHILTKHDADVTYMPPYTPHISIVVNMRD